jgi:4-hydroxy-tetrahydrodipicolinate reductase
MKGVPSARFIQYGLGPIGVEVAALALRRGHQLVAAVDIDPAKAGKPVAALIAAARPGVIVAARASDVVNTGADVVLHCTQSRLAQVLPQLLALVDAGLSVISTCEELAFPWHHFPTEAAALDTLARSRGAVVVGLGVNPGFVMDLLPVVLTASCSEVKRVVVERIVDVAGRRLPLQRKVGVGLSTDAFRAGISGGTIGHVGLPQSVAMIAHALTRHLERIEESIEPVVGSNSRVLGLHQISRGFVDSTPFITLDLTMAMGADHPRDRIRIAASPPVDAIIEGGLQGDLATYAIVVNAIGAVLASPPGLLSALHLPALSPSRHGPVPSVRTPGPTARTS